MDQKTRNYISKFLILAFLFFLLPSDNYISAGNERDGLKKIKAAEKLFIKYKYRESINKYIEAEEIVKSGKNLSRLYMGLSKAYYALGLEARTREVIRKIADLTFQSKVDETKLPRGYLKIYKEILARILKEKEAEKIAKIKKEKEESKIVRTEEKITELKPEIIVKDTEKPDKQVIERPGKKKKGKKSSILPIIGGALALGAAAFLLTKKKDPGDSGSNTASIHIESTPSNATVFVDGANKGTTPCDITVSEGSREILLLIGGWGETTKTQTFSKGSSYTLNAKLAPYIYKSVFSFSLDACNAYNWYWDCDKGGNIYTTVCNKLDKYDTSGNKVFSKNINGVASTTRVHIDKTAERIYLMNWDNSIKRANYQITDLDGNFITNWYNLPSVYLDVDTTGNHFIIDNTNGIVKKYDIVGSNFDLLGQISLETPHNYKRINLSEDNNYFFIGNRDTEGLYKYSLAGEYVTMWQGFDGYSFRGYNFSNFGTGDQEKVFYRTTNGSEYRIVISNGNGEYLTKTSNINYLWHICNDDSGNIYAGTAWSGSKGEITRYEPSSETEGSGTWTVASKLKRSNRSGFSNGISNTRKLQKRVDRNAIKKELKDKKEGKRIR